MVIVIKHLSGEFYMSLLSITRDDNIDNKSLKMA